MRWRNTNNWTCKATFKSFVDSCPFSKIDTIYKYLFYLE